MGLLLDFHNFYPRLLSVIGGHGDWQSFGFLTRNSSEATTLLLGKIHPFQVTHFHISLGSLFLHTSFQILPIGHCSLIIDH